MVDKLFSDFKLIPFFCFNCLIFFWGFINLDSVYPLSEAFIMSFIFFLILGFQFFVCFSFKKLSFFLSLFFCCGNLIFFNLVLNGHSFLINFFYLVSFSFLFILLHIVDSKKTIIFFFVLSLVSLFNIFLPYFFKRQAPKNDLSLRNISNKENSKNFFFIGIDGMVSSEVYFSHFSSYNPAYVLLDSIGYSTYDIYSAGFGTLETYAKLISYKNNIHTRESLKFFNFKKSSFYLDLKGMGLKSQFNFYTNYFGGDPNNIYDSFYPKISKPFSFVLYTDERWGWYSAFFIKNFFPFEFDKYSNQFEMIHDRINSIDLNKNKWVSISHLWFPGHTLGNYNFETKNDYFEFKEYYKSTHKDLSSFFKNITNSILERDPNAVIVFFGDHGAYFLKGAEPGSDLHGFVVNDLNILKDKKDVFLAFFPKDYLNVSEVENIKKNPELLFSTFIRKNWN